MDVIKFTNSLHLSSCFVLELMDNQVVLIDPGDPFSKELKNWLTSENKKIRAVFLTHEHADHCAGVNELYNLQPFQLFCSQSCATNIRNSKQNFSFYIDIIEAFEVSTLPTIVTDGETIEIEDRQFTIVETPGHSPGSVCIFFSNGVFTGDTILNGIKSPLTFPHSNRKQYAASIEKLLSLLKPGMTIYPGHGEPYTFEDFDKLLNQIKVSESNRTS